MSDKNVKSDIIENYKLIKKLGEGSFGEVWVARDLKRNEEVALKYLRLDLASQDYLEKFKHEFEILSQIRHKNLALVFDFGYSLKEKRYFFTSEFCPGTDFLRASMGKPFSYVEEMLVQTLSALDYVHSQGIVHFDIKSENILVSEENGHPHVKVLDFGIAAKLKELPESVVGTTAYMAPEIILKGSRLDHRADLYSLGILLLRTLTRRLPFIVENTDEVLKWHLKGEIPEALWAGVEIPHYVRELTEKLLRKRPEERFSNARVALHFINLSTVKKYLKAEQDLAGALPREGPLVERDMIIDQLRSDLESSMNKEATKNVSQVCLISGVQGIGKSRIIEEMRHVLQLKEIPFFELICNWEVPMWARIEKWLGLPPTSVKGATEDWQMRMRVDSIIEAGKKRPFCLLVDDFHKADIVIKSLIPALSDKLNFYRSEGQKIPIFILLATEEIIKDAIILKRLSSAGIEQFINLVLGDVEQAGAIAKLLYRYSGGLPLLVVEGLRFLAPHLYRNETLENLLPPPQIGLLYRKKMEMLKSDERELLSTMALLFRPSTEEELSNIMDLPSSIIFRLADVCTRNDLLIGSALSEGEAYVLQVSSQALNLDIIRSIKPKMAKEIHRRIAEGLLKTGKAPLNEIAYFTAKSGEIEKAVGYYRDASSDFKKRQQISQATDCLVKAINICPAKTPGWTQLLQEASELLIVSGSYREAEGYLKKLTIKGSYAVEELNGDLAFKQRRFAPAKEHYQKAIQLIPEEKYLERILIKNSIGNVVLQTGDCTGASEIFSAALEEEMKLPMEERRRIRNNALGLTLALLGKTDEAVHFYEEQLKKLTPDMISEEISLVCSLGYVFMHASRYDEAIPYLTRAVDLSEKTGAMHYLFSSIGNLVTAFVKEARYAEALPFLTKMSAYQERLGTMRDIAYNLLREGDIYLLVGMEEAAAECFKRGRKLSQEMNDQTLAAWFLLMEGYRQRDFGIPEKAKELFDVVLNEAALLKDKNLGAWTHYALADLSCETGKHEECQRQIDMIEEIPDDEEFKVRLDILKAESSAPRFEGDINSLFSPLEALCLEKKFPELLWEIYYSWGHAMKNRGSRVEAIQLFLKGIGIVETIAEALPEEYRDRYLNQRARKNLFSDFKELTAPSKMEGREKAEGVEVEKQITANGMKVERTIDVQREHETEQKEPQKK